MSDFVLAHFTDPHVTTEGTRLKNGVDSNQRLLAAIERLLSLRISANAAVFTGDLVDRGNPAEYQMFERLIQPLRHQMPVYLLLGNHDHRAHFLSNTPATPTASAVQQHDWIQFSVPLCPGHRLIALDSVEHGQDAGFLCPTRLTWLEETLDRFAHEEILLAVHHPPIRSGHERFDGIGLTNAHALESVLEPRTNIRLVICGHLHRAVSGWIAHSPVVSAPSTAHPYAIDHAIDFKGSPDDELPGFALHRLIDRCRWVSHQVWFYPAKAT